jgi:hypothetical protein
MAPPCSELPESYGAFTSSAGRLHKRACSSRSRYAMTRRTAASLRRLPSCRETSKQSACASPANATGRLAGNDFMTTIKGRSRQAASSGINCQTESMASMARPSSISSVSTDSHHRRRAGAQRIVVASRFQMPDKHGQIANDDMDDMDGLPLTCTFRRIVRLR